MGAVIIIEDKAGLKKNSFFGTDVEQTQDSIENFCGKIAAGKKVRRTDDFMIIAREESLMLEKGLDNAIHRANAYAKAGADGIMIHSKKQSPEEIFDFCDSFRKNDEQTPIIVVPTTYFGTYEADLIMHGVNIVIYSNQLTRSAFPAMKNTAKSILQNHRAKEAEEQMISFQKIITLINAQN